MRRGIFAIAVMGLAVAVGTGPAGIDARPDRGGSGWAAPPPVMWDADGDGVFEDLERELAEPGRQDRFDVVVLLEAPATQARIAALQDVAGAFEVTRRYESFPAFAATMQRRQVRTLAAEPVVVHVEDDALVVATNDTAQSSSGVGAARAGAGVDGDGDGALATYSRDDLTAAVIDTGIDAAHRDLDEGKVIGWRDLVNGRSTPYDDHSHGTHVAATIAGEGDARTDLRYRGVAPGASLVGVKVLNGAGSGSLSTIAAGIDWVTSNRTALGIEAANLSLGASGCGNGTDVMAVAVNAAHDAGIVMAVAAGNSGPGRCTVNSPGTAAKALTVGAMADLGVGGFSLASFSSRGFTSDGRIKPDVAAPGVTITSAAAGTSTGYSTKSGTSMATPFVAGVALLMRDASPGMSAQAVKDTIMSTAQDWARGGDNRTAGTGGADVDYGAGRLDAFAAIEAAAGHDIGAAPSAPTHLLADGTLAATGARVDVPLDVNDTTVPIAATLIHPSVTASSSFSPDFDLALLAPSGSQVASATTSSRQDTLSHQPSTTGRYVLRVTSWSGSGPYVVDISAGLGEDTGQPSVVSIVPADGATGVATDANVAVAFSEAMDHATTQASFSLAPATDLTSALPGTFAWTGTTMTFDPAQGLTAGTQYVARVAATATDTSGNALAAPASSSFTASSTMSASPSSTTIETGSLRAGSAASLAADDSQYFRVTSTSSGTRTTSWYATTPGVPNAASDLRVTYRGSNSRSCTQVTSIWNWTTSSWTTLDTRSVGQSEVQLTNLAPPASGDWVSGSSGSGDVRVRLRCTRSSSRSFYASGDLLRISWQ